jgi:transposase
LRFKSKNTLAKEMLKEIIPYIPDDYKVYVLFDRWYTSANLIKYIRRQGWHVIGAIKSNRKVNGIQIKKWPELLRNKRYIKAKYIATDGTTKQFFVRRIEGKLSSIDEDICVLISKRHNREKNSKYFICTDRNLSTNKILNLYSKRWPIEVEYWYLKEYLGLGDFRVQSYNAISKWYTIVYLVLTFLQWRLYETDIQDSSIKSVADVIHKHRREHIVELIRYICKKIMGGYTDMDFLINHFIAGS